jgi:hypothetical protein
MRRLFFVLLAFVLVASSVLKGYIQVVEQLLTCKPVRRGTKKWRICVHWSDKCCTALTAKPLYRLLLFCGLTPPLLKFRFRALRLLLNVDDQ